MKKDHDQPTGFVDFFGYSIGKRLLGDVSKNQPLETHEKITINWDKTQISQNLIMLKENILRKVFIVLQCFSVVSQKQKIPI